MPEAIPRAANETVSLHASDFEPLARSGVASEVLQLDGSEDESLVGARQEALDRWISQILTGDGSLLLLSGPPGAGTARHSLTVGGQVRRAGGRTYTATCGDRSEPYGPVADWISMRSADLQADGDSGLLKEILKQHAELAVLIGPPWSDWIKTPNRPPGSSGFPRALADGLLRCCGGTRPVILILERLENADEGTIGVLVHLANRITDAHIGILARCETDSNGRLPDSVARALIRIKPHVRIALEGLDRQGMEDLIDLLLGHHLFSRDLLGAIWAACAGSPEAVSEVLRHLVSQGVIYQTEGVWRERPGVSNQRPPNPRCSRRLPCGWRSFLRNHFSSCTFSQQTRGGPGAP